MACDSRISTVVTKQDGSTVVIVDHDNMLKNETIESTHNTVVASAGAARFAKYMLNKLAKADFIDGGTEVIRANINNWLSYVAVNFIKDGFALATFYFAGSDPNKKKVVDGQRIIR
ncbi:hypothetical protein IPL85_01495 [Candidatus Saccharibacteria bacterium]|nr:MAG: hypothetical protein IPL85_01495 [Candidatus Saccharibacteria bacterium]